MFVASVIILILGAMFYQLVSVWFPGKVKTSCVKTDNFYLQAMKKSTSYPDDKVLLFLDFDGVIHSRMNESFERMPLLEEILEQCPEMLIVISSSWRESLTVGGLRMLFSPYYRERIIGVTPVIKNTSGLGFIRHKECLSFANDVGISRFIIVDDETQKFPSWCDELISTEYCVGLTKKSVEHIVHRYRYLIE